MCPDHSPPPYPKGVRQLKHFCVCKRAHVAIVPTQMWRKGHKYLKDLYGGESSELYIMLAGRPVAQLLASELLPEGLAVVVGQGQVHILRLEDEEKDRG